METNTELERLISEGKVNLNKPKVDASVAKEKPKKKLRNSNIYNV